MDENLQNQLDRLEATMHVQSVDVSALLNEISNLAFHVQKLSDALPSEYQLPNELKKVPDVLNRFLTIRKELLQQQLEALETKNPARAAKLQNLIDDSCKIFPFDYD